MITFVLIIFLTGPLTDDIGIGGTIVKVGPVPVASFTGTSAEKNCLTWLNRMIKSSGEKVEGRCDPWP